MAHVSCHALLIDPNPATAVQMQQLLTPASSVTDSFLFQLDAVSTLEAGLQSLVQSQPASMQKQSDPETEEVQSDIHQESYDLLLLEISLFHEFSVQQGTPQPSSDASFSWNSSRSVANSAADSSPVDNSAIDSSPTGFGEFALPVIVISQQEDEALAQQAIERGAYGYLLMPQLSLKNLQYTAWVAMQKHQQLQALRQIHQLQARELESWDQLARQRSSPRLTAQIFDAGALRDMLPDQFGELVEEYGQALDSALERRAYRVQASRDDLLRALAEQLGFLHAGPRDVVDMHTQALRQKTQDAVPEKIQAYLSESRLTVLEVMGDLVSYYRRHSLGISQMKTYHREDSS